MSLTKIPAAMRTTADRTYVIDYLIVEPANGSWPVTLSFGRTSRLNWIKVRTGTGTVDVAVTSNATPAAFTGPVTAVEADSTIEHYDTVADNVFGAGSVVAVVLTDFSAAEFLIISMEFEELA